MKQGLVEPPDFIHADNPAAYPLLLNELAASFAAMNYDIKAFLGELARSKAYQRSITIPEDLLQDAAAATETVGQCERQLAFEKQVVARAEAAFDASVEQLQSTREGIKAVRSEIATVLQQRQQTIKQRDEASKQLEDRRQQRDQQAAFVSALQLAMEKAQQASEQRQDDSALKAVHQQLTEQVAAAQGTLVQLEQQVATQQATVQQSDEAIAANESQLATLRQTLSDRATRAVEESGEHRGAQGDVRRRKCTNRRLEASSQVGSANTRFGPSRADLTGCVRTTNSFDGPAKTNERRSRYTPPTAGRSAGRNVGCVKPCPTSPDGA